MVEKRREKETGGKRETQRESGKERVAERDREW